MLYAKDRAVPLHKAAKKTVRKGPKRVRLSRDVRSAYRYEIFLRGPDARPFFLRTRAWIFSGEERTYGIRVFGTRDDGVEGLHPELAFMLKNTSGE